MAIINPGDEIVVFEPFYENYGPDAILSGATPRFVKMRPAGDENSVWTYDEDELAAAFGPNTKAIILNTPNNPTGKVFTRAELEFIRDLCVRWNAFCITDEIYEHILYDGTEHISMARIDGMRERTIVINGMSKTYSVTGWRVGWAIAPPEATASIRKVHDFLTVGAAAPLQQAGAVRAEVAAGLLRQARVQLRRKARAPAQNPDASRLHRLQAARRLLHHDRHFPLPRSGSRRAFRRPPETSALQNISSKKSASPPSPAPASTTTPTTAPPKSASPSARRKKPLPPPNSVSQGCNPGDTVLPS